MYDETTQLGSNINLTISAGNILQLAWDIDNGKGWIGINNTWYRTNATDGNPSAGTNETFTFTGKAIKSASLHNGTSTDVHTINFGQDSTFHGEVSAGGNADANGEGDFAYAPPTNFFACCSRNPSRHNIKSKSSRTEFFNDHFNTVLYTGDGNATQNITGVGFMPDWTWLKEPHHLVMFLQGSRGYEKFLTSHTSNAESTEFLNNNATRTNDGFQTTNSGASNENGQTYVAWNWKANGGTTSSNGDGSTNIHGSSKYKV